MRTLVLALLLVGWATTGRAYDKLGRVTYEVQPGCTLKIDTYRGSINVDESEDSQVRVRIQFSVEGTIDKAEGERVLETLQLEQKQEGNTVSIFARNPTETRVRFTWNDRNRIDLAYFISVPKSCNVDLTTADGSITVGNVDGRHRARAELGKIFFRRIDGSLDAVCGEGDIIMSRCSGDATLRTRRGTIRIGWVGGKADLKNSSGDIEIQNAVGGLTAHAEAGDVQAGFPKEVTGDAKVTTNGGTIYARFDAEAHCSIDATSSVLGHVESSLPLASESGSVSRSHLAGKLNGGGTKIVLKASGGHVKIDSATVPIDE